MPEVRDPPPTPPEKPLPMDCCGGGCAMCVMDVYDEALQRYEAELAAWQARNSAQSDVAPAIDAAIPATPLKLPGD